MTLMSLPKKIPNLSTGGQENATFEAEKRQPKFALAFAESMRMVKQSAMRKTALIMAPSTSARA